MTKLKDIRVLQEAHLINIKEEENYGLISKRSSKKCRRICKSFSKERSERCAWITAAVAKYTAETLNKYADGAFKMVHPLSSAAQACRSCHDKGSKLENTRSMMDCGGI